MPSSDGRAALALIAGLLQVFRDLGALEPAAVGAVFDHALKVLPDRETDARRLIIELRRETVIA